MTSVVLDALGDPTRRLIIEVLAAAGERPAGAVVQAVQAQVSISQPAVSQHLKVLREAGLVTVRAEGTRRHYAVDRSGVDEAVAWLMVVGDTTAHLGQRLDALATEVERGKRTRRAAASEADRRRDTA